MNERQMQNHLNNMFVSMQKMDGRQSANSLLILSLFEVLVDKGVIHRDMAAEAIANAQARAKAPNVPSEAREVLEQLQEVFQTLFPA